MGRTHRAKPFGVVFYYVSFFGRLRTGKVARLSAWTRWYRTEKARDAGIVAGYKGFLKVIRHDIIMKGKQKCR